MGDIHQAKGLFDLLDQDGSGNVDTVEFVSGCLRLRGNAKALDMSLHMRQMMDMLAKIDASLVELSMNQQQQRDGSGPPTPVTLQSRKSWGAGVNEALQRFQRRKSVNSVGRTATANSMFSHSASLTSEPGCDEKLSSN